MRPLSIRVGVKQTFSVVIAISMIAAACGSDTNPEPVETTTGPSNEVPATDSLSEAFADLEQSAPVDSLALEPIPVPEDILPGLIQLDWVEIFAGSDPEAIRDRFADLVTELDQGAGSTGATAVGGPTVELGRGVGVARFVADAHNTTETVTEDFEEGTVSGTATGTKEVTIDPVTARRTITLTLKGEGVDSATGEKKSVELVMRWEHDLCWNEEGGRSGEYEKTITTTVEKDGTTTTSTESRQGGVTENPFEGTFTVTWGSGNDGNTTTATGTFPGGMGPSGDSNSASSSTEDGDTQTVVWENGFEMKVSGPGSGYVPNTVDKVSDYENFLSELAWATPPSRVEWEEFCVRITVEPESASLGLDGETLGITVSVTDWTGTPLPDASVRVTAPKLGAFTGPTSGFSDHNGEFATLYSSDQAGRESILVPVQYLGFEPIGELIIEIGEPWALAMTMDVERVTFLWDGTFLVGDSITGAGIGTVLGEGHCQVTGSGGTYNGPIAEITGAFTFSVGGSETSDESGDWLTLKVESSEADIEFSFEDPVCGDFVEIARDFLRLVPSFPSYLPDGIVIQVSNGFGTTDVPFEPYILEVDVTKLGE